MPTNCTIIKGNALEKLGGLDSNSVHCCACSPPYFPALRNYGGDPVLWGDGWTGSLGDEPDPQQFCDHLVEVFDGVKRVLRDDGSLWVNLGDSFAKNNKYKKLGIKRLDLFGTPWLFAFSMRKNGWYLRNDQIWHKAGSLPESVKNRCGRDHEYIFHFTKTDRYYFDLLSVREPVCESSLKRIAQKSFNQQKGGEKDYGKTGINASRSARKTIENFAKNPGRNKRTVWKIPVARLKEKHFASYPTELPRICLLMSTSEYGCCTDCGTPWERIISSKRVPTRPARKNKHDETGKSNRDPQRHITFYETDGWRKVCDCETTEVIPCMVLDPFNGAGSTGVAAIETNRRYVGIELFDEYVEMSKRRLLKSEQEKSRYIFQ